MTVLFSIPHKQSYHLTVLFNSAYFSVCLWLSVFCLFVYYNKAKQLVSSSFMSRRCQIIRWFWKGVRWSRKDVRWSWEGIRWSRKRVRWSLEGVRWSRERVRWSWECVRRSWKGVRWTREGVRSSDSDGLEKVSDGLEKLSDGLGKVSDGLGKESDGLRKVTYGLGRCHIVSGSISVSPAL